MDWQWDKWQQEVLEHEGNITIRAGRQVGKSEVISEKALRFALAHAGTTTLIIAASQRQSSLLFEKVRGRADALGLSFAEKPTLTKLVLVNGSRILSLPAGRTAYSIRGLTLDLLICDEAAYIPEQVWVAITPMLAVSRQVRKFGWLITISTPLGKGGYFYDTFTDKDFLQIHVSSEDCRRLSPKYLRREREKMSKQEYAQEYLGEFIDDYCQFFPTALLKRQMSFIDWSLEKDKILGSKLYLGVDLARYGGDENAFVVCEIFDKRLRVVKCFTTDRVSCDTTIGEIVRLEKAFGFSKIFLDDAGVGGAITDVLIDRLGRHKVVGVNNASRRVEVQGDERKRGILKEDLYSNAQHLMETGRLELISNLDLLRSLKSMQFKYTEHGRVVIFGKYSHLSEAMVRAVWGIKEQGLRLFCY